jgi:pyruvate formate lyase activating enzyme
MVLEITRMTVHNGPGIRTLISFKGCPLQCIWCSTPESRRETQEIGFYPDKCIFCGDCVAICPTQALSVGESSVILDRGLCDDCGVCVNACHSRALKTLGRGYTVDELVREILKDAVMYKHSGGGVTLSGGEPFLRTEFLLSLLKDLTREDINIGIDTCGFTPRENIQSVLPYVDFFLWDIKHMDDATHKQLTGVSNRLIIDNLRVVSEKGIPVYIRIPLIPEYNDADENLRAVCKFVQTLPSLVEIDLLPLHHLGRARYQALGWEYPIEDLPLYQESTLNEMKSLVESFGLKCNIIG